NSAFTLYQEGRFVALRWHTPNPDAVHALSDIVEDAHDRHGPVLLCPIIGPECPPPDGATREAFTDTYDLVHDCSQSVRLVVLGAGARQSFMRGVITTLTVATGLRGQGFVVDKSIRETVRIAEQTLGLDGEALLRALIEGGLVSAEESKL
ncbi:MAG: hypothetical protein KC457_14070, partial [Myxococcales bacterium]|nr:hypothetical protein [Myxococcales bacterium]